ncbi:MAG TPA: cation:proton antiporter [Flavobacteriales bacterium]|nr:cation:proton antiporter [Flavobacteriales bacterium]HNE81199.1 cation:proton antiporter [Flavobacteriales bacterium]HNI05518.1 cation:proton antiporter [Flavobacteriales bacterium]HNK40050.1 cation:proton antiporter [Flavobacteriales bacterium]HNO04163.1 cation:proton antiporter [Flavobacteriales bacterium]
MHGTLHGELIIVLALAVGILLLFRRLKLPNVLGFIIAGLLAGPHALGWVAEVETVETLAELGVIFLLFVIGMEFSLKKLASISATVFIGGSLQAVLTTALTAGIGRLLGLAMPTAVFTGFLVTLSSTAIVLRILQEQGRTDQPFGRITAAILIFQDIIVVPMMLVTPMLAGQSSNIGHDLLMLVLKMLLLVVAVYLLGRFGVPRLLRAVSKGRNKELFIITIVVLCFSAAWATSALGLSLALGAFFAGLIISETDQVYHATGIVQPFHELFMSFFFVSIGMLVDPALFASRPLTVIGLALLVVLLKSLAGFLSVWVLRHPVATSLKCGIALAQVGEFAFVLAITGLGTGLLSRDHHQVFLAVSILTMGATPFAMRSMDPLVRRVLGSLLPPTVLQRLEGLSRPRPTSEDRSPTRSLNDHIVIIGYGLNGQNVALAAQSARIRCAVIEEDVDLAQKARARGMHAVIGDASNEHVLEQAHVENARVVVIAIADAETTRRITATVRAHTSAYIIVRTRYVREIGANLDAGANEVIPEEFETSIEIFYRVLRKYLVPERSIQELVAHIRGDHYGMLRGTPSTGTIPATMTGEAGEMGIATVPVDLGRSRIAGRTLAHVDLHGRFGITLLAIRRKNRVITRPEAEERIQQDDLLYLLGTPANIRRLDHELR